MECASHACALLKHGFSNPNMFARQKLYACKFILGIIVDSIKNEKETVNNECHILLQLQEKVEQEKQP
jgi:hypothetical protein